MPKMTLQQVRDRPAAACTRYAAAAREFRESMAELGAAFNAYKAAQGLADAA